MVVDKTGCVENVEPTDVVSGDGVTAKDDEDAVVDGVVLLVKVLEKLELTTG